MRMGLTKRAGWIVLAPVVVAGVLLAGSSAAAQPPGRGGWGPGMGPGRGMMGPRGALGLGFALGRLDLTDAQRQQIRTIVQGHRQEFQALAERRRAAQQALQAAMTAEPLDEAAIRSASATLAEVQADAAVLRAKIRREVFAVLTPEQQAKAKALREEARTRFEQRRQRRMNRPGAGL